MDEAPLIKAHDHAQLASDYTRAGKAPLAVDEHNLAAYEFAKAAKSTTDREALKILQLLETHHHKLAQLIQNPPPRAEEKDASKADLKVESDSKTVKSNSLKERARPESRHKGLGQLSPDHGSTIADNLASVRGIPSRRDKALSPTVTAQLAQGYNSQHRSSNPARRPKQASQSQTPAAQLTEPEDEAPPDAFQTFYSAFGNVISKISAPLAFAGLPLDGNSTTDTRKDTATADIEVDHLYSKPALRAIREDRGHSAADSFYVVPTGGGTIPYSRIALQNNKTREELQLENATLKKLTDDLSKRLHSWEANAQSSSMALQQSLRALSDHGQDEKMQKLEEENRRLRKTVKALKPS